MQSSNSILLLGANQGHVISVKTKLKIRRFFPFNLLEPRLCWLINKLDHTPFAKVEGQWLFCAVAEKWLTRQHYNCITTTQTFFFLLPFAWRPQSWDAKEVRITIRGIKAFTLRISLGSSIFLVKKKIYLWWLYSQVLKIDQWIIVLTLVIRSTHAVGKGTEGEKSGELREKGNDWMLHETPPSLFSQTSSFSINLDLLPNSYYA